MRDDVELKIEYMPVDELIPSATNSKLHPHDQVDQIAESIELFGNCDPIGVWTDSDGETIIVEGHGRVMALKKLGWEKAPVIYLDHLSDSERRQYSILHNQLTMNSGFDFATLEREFESMPDFDWDSFGFDDPFFSSDQSSDGYQPPKQPSEVDVPDEATHIVERGQVWQLGNHRLMCGDSTDAEDVSTLMDGSVAELLFTSPPYSDMREYNGGKDLDEAFLAKFISTYAEHCHYQAVNLGIKRQNHEIIRYWDRYIAEAESSGLKLMSWNVWDKTFCGSPAQQSALVPVRHEFIFVFGKTFKDINITWDKKPENIKDNVIGRRRNADGTMSVYGEGDTSKPYKKMESVLQCPPNTGPSSSLHPATFPVRLPFEYIQAFTDEGDVVAEPFGGSGTTIIAAEQLGRRCFAMELDPNYCDVIIERWQSYTGQEATLCVREG
jgi:DNA modification methylase